MAAGSVAVPRIIPVRAPGHGRAKHVIDSDTPVEMNSDSPGVQIFYTLDGSRPEAWRGGVAGGSSRRYSGALLLPPGRVSLKALAATRDGRQSSTVTKLFLVAGSAAEHQEVGKEALQSTGSRTPSRPAMGHPAGFFTGRLGPQDHHTQKKRSSPQEPPGLETSQKTLQATLSHAHSTRVLQEADFLRCTRCLCDRPSDPFSRFCIHCGSALPPIPGQRLPPSEEGQLAVCVVCNTLVPVNTPTCLICEAAIPPQRHPQASLHLQDKVLCVACGSVNPAHISHCVTCESRLTPATWAPPPAGAQRHACSKCHRVNNKDARYCDWCGSKASQPPSRVQCGGCGGSSQPYASYCCTCGLVLVAPPPCCSGPAGGAAHPQATPPRARAPPTADGHTQTVGLFYPSSAALHHTHQQRALAERSRPPLTAVSPGRGYWRRQVDHVCAHLRSYAQNTTHFRTLLGEPRMGRMLSAEVKEDDFEVSLKLNFLLVEPEPQASRPRTPEAPQSSVTEGQSRDLPLSSVTEGQNTTRPGRTQPATRQKPRLQTTQKPLDSLLLEEVGPGGRGSVGVVQQLLEQGADSMCQDSKGQPVLMVAIVTGRHDIIPVLVQRGADVNQQSGPFKNTPLHEAACRGSEGLQSARVLLGCRARMQVNARGETAYDLSLTSGCPPMVQLLAAQLGHTLLGRLLPGVTRGPEPGARSPGPGAWSPGPGACSSSSSSRSHPAAATETPAGGAQDDVIAEES